MTTLNILNFNLDIDGILKNSQCSPVTIEGYNTFIITECSTVACTTVECNTIECTNIQCSLCSNDSGNDACDCAYDTYCLDGSKDE